MPDRTIHICPYNNHNEQYTNLHNKLTRITLKEKNALHAINIGPYNKQNEPYTNLHIELTRISMKEKYSSVLILFCGADA